MPNRYDDLTFNNGDYVKQYSGIPLEQIRHTADTLAGQHYQNLAKLNQLQLVAEQYKSKMLPGAKPYVDQHISDISSALQDIAQNGGEHSTARVAAIGNKFLGDQGVLSGLQTAESVNREIDIENKLLAENKMPIRKAGQREAVMNAPIIDPSTGQISKPYTSPYQSTVSQYEDPVPHMARIWDEIKPDSIEGQLKGVDGLTLKRLLGESMSSGLPDIPLFFEALTHAGIGKGKIDTMLNSAWSSYQQTPAYKQAIDYANDPQAERKRQKDQFYKHGLLNTFNNLQRQAVGNPIADDLLKAKKPVPTGQVTQAPGTTLDTLFQYGDDGKDIPLVPNVQAKDPSELGMGSGAYGSTGYKQAGFDDPNRPISEQFKKDWRTMADIKGGTKDIADDTDQARSYAKEYRKLVEHRVSHPYVKTLTKDEGLEANYKVQSEFGLYSFADPITGKTVTPFDNHNQMTDEFAELTGGDPTKFRIESAYGPKNHYATMTGGNEKFVAPFAVVSESGTGDDKVQKRFIMSRLPENTDQGEINTNVVYNKVNLRPGQEVEVHPRVKAKSLHGKQLDGWNLTPEQRQGVDLPIEATIDGNTVLFDNPERLAQYLQSRGINLSY